MQIGYVVPYAKLPLVSFADQGQVAGVHNCLQLAKKSASRGTIVVDGHGAAGGGRRMHRKRKS